MTYLSSTRVVTETPQHLAMPRTHEIKSEKHAMVCLFGRGFSQLCINYLKNLAEQSGMPHRLLGNLTSIQEPSKSLSTATLIPMTGNEGDDIVHNVYLFHGGITNGKHVVNVRHDDLEEVSTSNLMRAMHRSPSLTDADRKKINIDYHLSCKSAKLRNEFSADEAFWKTNISLIFCSKKSTSFEQAGAALESALRYASFCNTPGKQMVLDQFKLFLLAGMRRGDCLTMLGGELKAPLIWHAPKNQEDLLLQNMLNNVRGHPMDCERLKQTALSLTHAQIDMLPPASAQLRDMLFTRLARDDIGSVIQILQHDENLKNEKSVFGVPALIWTISLGMRQCTDYLLSAGADVNAIDAYGNTALIYALNKDEPELLKKILEKGANPNARDFNGNSPLMIAVSKCWLEQVQYLIQFHAKLDVWNNRQTALMMAVNEGDYDIVDALLMAGADASCGLDKALIAQAEEQDHLAILDLLERSLIEDSGNDESVDMEIDGPASEYQ